MESFSFYLFIMISFGIYRIVSFFVLPDVHVNKCKIFGNLNICDFSSSLFDCIGHARTQSMDTKHELPSFTRCCQNFDYIYSRVQDGRSTKILLIIS